MSNINDSILEAIDIVIQQRLQQLNFDNTIVCTVVDSSKREEGEYTVEYQDSIRLTAYSENKTYLNDSKVYVLVPEGDWSKQKTIIGRYKSEDENTPITYVAPSAYVAEVKTVNKPFDKSEWGIVAKPEKFEEVDGEKKNINATQILIGQYSEIPAGVDIANIKASFKSFISSTLLQSGQYGLYIIGYDSVEIDEETKQPKDSPVSKYTLGSIDIFGNPYQLLVPQVVEKNINIKDIKMLEFYLYQTGNFDIEPIDDDKAQKNIFVQDISITFGYDITSRKDDTLEIIGQEPTRYDSSKPDEKMGRTVSLFWFNKDKNNKYLGLTDGEFDIKAKPTDEQVEYDTTYYWIEWEKSDNGGSTWQSIETTGKEDKINLELSTTASTMVQAYLYVNGEKKPSNIITYLNNANDLAQTQLSVSLKIINANEKTTFDNYALYGANGVLNNSGDAYTKRVLSYDYSLPEAHKESIKGSYLASTENTEIIWRIPVNSTMIAAPKEVEMRPRPGAYWIKNINQECYEYHTTIIPIYKKDKEGNPTTEIESYDLGNMSYRIKNTFEPWAINNTISLEIIQTINDTVYTYRAEKSISLSSFGSSGTNYTFIAKPSRQAYYIIDGNGNTSTDEQLVFELFDKDGKLQEPFLQDDPKITKVEHDYIKATTTVKWLDKNTILTTYYPTATAADATYSYEGPTFVTYDSFGANPTYYREALKLHGYGGIVKWSAGENEKDINIKNKDSIFTAEFSNLFAADSTSFIRVWHINAYSENDELLWTQPVLGLQNKYGSDLLNNWDGSLQIDNNGNQILAASIVAGTKSNNEFTGVAIGELSKISDASSGVLGFQNGIQTFGFGTDGKAFIGASGRGRIYFNGDDGVIISPNWIENGSIVIKTSPSEIPTGSKIDLNKGHIYMKQKNDYFIFNDDGLQISSDSIRLTSEDKDIKSFIDTSIENGITASVSNKLDANGPESASTFTWNLGSSGFYINNSNIANSNNYIFKVDANGASINGNINATSGSVGNIKITKTAITSNNFNNIQFIKSIRHSVNRNDSSTININNWNSQSATVWINDYYKIGGEGTIIFTPQIPSKIEYYVLDSVPEQANEKFPYVSYFEDDYATSYTFKITKDMIGKFLLINYRYDNTYKMNAYGFQLSSDGQFSAWEGNIGAWQFNANFMGLTTGGRTLQLIKETSFPIPGLSDSSLTYIGPALYLYDDVEWSQGQQDIKKTYITAGGIYTTDPNNPFTVNGSFLSWSDIVEAVFNWKITR